MEPNVTPTPSYDSTDLPPVGETPKKNNKTWLIILIVALVLCCCCVVAGLAGSYLYNNGDELFKDFTYLAPMIA